MHTFEITFDYDGITDPDTCETLTGNAAQMQFRAELAEVFENFGPSLVGWRVVEWLGGHYCIVAITVTEELTVDAQAEHIQQVFYDEGGLSGDFMCARIQRFTVQRMVQEEVWAYSQANARTIASRRYDSVLDVLPHVADT